MKGIYLASYQAIHKNYDIDYQDINGKRDISGDMMNVELEEYDFIIATPPCNWWSRANWRRNTSEYALKTKHLLPDILKKLIQLNKPFIVENVRSQFYEEYNLLQLPVYIYTHGRHTYWTNVPFNPYFTKQIPDNIQNASPNVRDQGGENVHNVIEKWLETLMSKTDYETGKKYIQTRLSI